MHRLDKKELEKMDIHALPDVLSLSLWVMEYLSEELENYFGASDISNYLTKKLGISTSRQAVHAALTSAVKKKLCHKDKKGFSIMKLGQDELLKQMQKERVVYIEPGKPFTAGTKLESIFESMTGTLKISDPYIDVKTLDVLFRSNVSLPLRILTVNIKDEASFQRELTKFQHEGYNIEVRKISQGDLHDRYFIDDKHFWLSGNSLNNLGKKESFIVALDGDIRKSMLQVFDSRWQSGIVI